MTRARTLEKYSELMLALIENYKVRCVADFLSAPLKGQRIAVLRHDVGRMPERAAQMALLEKRLGLRATYYFRWDPKAIYWAGTGEDRYGNFPELQVTEAELYGHEVGYLPVEGEDAASRLTRLRKLAPVVTAAEHVGDSEILGGPFSPAFSDFFCLDDTDKGWKTGSGRVLKNTDEVIGLLKTGEHSRILLGIRPERWRG